MKIRGNLKVIYLIPLSNFDITPIEKAKVYVEEVYKEKVSIKQSVMFPEGCYNSSRNQYDAECVLKQLPSYKETLTLYITDKDLYVQGLNFVFGLALPYEGKSIVSIARLKESFYGKKEDKELLILRTTKEIIHELGHLKGLPHCPDAKCVMHFSNSLYDTDYKGYELCEKCRRKLKQ